MTASPKLSSPGYLLTLGAGITANASPPARRSPTTHRPTGEFGVIAGYTIANDYGLHDFRETDAGSMLRVTGSDTLCPRRAGAYLLEQPRSPGMLDG